MNRPNHTDSAPDTSAAESLPERLLPVADFETEEFWAGCRNHKLLLQRCADCGPYFYPRGFCPSCWRTDVETFEASGRGSVYTYSVVHQNPMSPFRDRVPYVVAMIDLEEGPRMMTNIVGCEPGAVFGGMQVEVCFEEHSGEHSGGDAGAVSLPQFRPTAGAPGSQIQQPT